MTKSSPIWQERRTHRRTRLIVQVDCRGQSAVSMGNSIDVSESGLLMVTSETLKPGTEVVVRFALPASSQAITIETKGIVVRELPWKSIAIQFVDLKEEDRRAIAQYVKADAAQAL